jgi:uncharacterized membrane protein
MWLSRIMTGRAVFIHLGAMLATIMLVNVEQRIWPVARRLLAATPVKQMPSVSSIQTAAMRLRHNAALALAVILFMVSNHFPLVYGSGMNGLVAPAVVVTGWLMSRLFLPQPHAPGNLFRRTAS